MANLIRSGALKMTLLCYCGGVYNPLNLEYSNLLQKEQFVSFFDEMPWLV